MIICSLYDLSVCIRIYGFGEFDSGGGAKILVDTTARCQIKGGVELFFDGSKLPWTLATTRVQEDEKCPGCDKILLIYYDT